MAWADAVLKTTKINNRRYLGNKYRLLPFIRSVVDRECHDVYTVVDAFAGTGAVASAFSDRRLVVNDTLYSNYLCYVAWFNPGLYSEDKVASLIARYNGLTPTDDNYMSNTFGGTFFSVPDCRKIGYIREDIEARFLDGDITLRERCLLVTSLLYAADKIANTCGHYDAYRRETQFDRQLELALPTPDAGLDMDNACCNSDARDIAEWFESDLLYMDPPYNSRQYCDCYHVLENLARWEKPPVRGVARKMDRSGLKSDWCTNKATAAFERMVMSAKTRYILLSYNNMAQKGDVRSNARISDDDIMRVLSERGRVKVFTIEYKPFTAGKSDIQGNEERLFLCFCGEGRRPLVQSPLNYTGGKFGLLPQILPLFPRDVDVFIDLFCGGGNIGANAEAGGVVLNDVSAELMGLLGLLASTEADTLISQIDAITREFGLSRSSTLGYAHYGCDGSAGLTDFNRPGFLRLRTVLNALGEVKDDRYYTILLTLVVFSFNNQMRFNSRGEFNAPVGKRDFNQKMRAKLRGFSDRLHDGRFSFQVGSFREFDPSTLTPRSLVYCDPPYLITCAGYNENGGWTEEDDADLMAFLDGLDARGLRFAMSNVLTAKGRENSSLIGWSGKYRVAHLSKSYANSSYQIKDRSAPADEVLITNY